MQLKPMRAMIQVAPVRIVTVITPSQNNLVHVSAPTLTEVLSEKCDSYWLNPFLISQDVSDPSWMSSILSHIEYDNVESDFDLFESALDFVTDLDPEVIRFMSNKHESGEFLLAKIVYQYAKRLKSKLRGNGLYENNVLTHKFDSLYLDGILLRKHL